MKLKDSSLIELELASEAKLKMSPQRSYSELAAKLELSFAAKLKYWPLALLQKANAWFTVCFIGSVEFKSLVCPSRMNRSSACL